MTPLEPDQIPPALRALPALQRRFGGKAANIYRTFAHHPAIARRWIPFADALRFDGVLSSQLRELVILRTARHLRCEYEWSHHEPIARAAGIEPRLITALEAGAPADCFPQWARPAIEVVDELTATARISDGCWEDLAADVGVVGALEVCVLVGQYHLVAFVVHGAGVEVDAVRSDRENRVNP